MILLRALHFCLWCTLITGILYPLSVTCLSVFLIQPLLTLHRKPLVTPGLSPPLSLVFTGKDERFLWPRPSASHYQLWPSGASQLSPAQKEFQIQRIAFFAFWKQKAPEAPEDPPEDLLSTSASGLDPEVSLEAALYQLPRIAQARQKSVLELKAFLFQWLAQEKKTRVPVMDWNQALENNF